MVNTADTRPSTTPDTTLTLERQPEASRKEVLRMAIAPQRTGIGIRRHFTSPEVHPYDQIAWERRDARITN